MLKSPLKNNFGNGLYPEREESRLDWTDRLATTTGGMLAPFLRPRPERFKWIVDAVNFHSPEAARLADAQIPQACRDLGYRLRKVGGEKDPVARSFALIREVAGRTVGMRHLDVQLIGGLVMLGGMVAEMETGEGKTLTATLTACTLALMGIPVHVITVNDYLAQRDAEWMRPIYRGLGLTVGTVVHGIDPGARRKAYRCDVTYCTNKEVVFDYLRDRIVLWDRPGPLRLRLERLYGEKARANRLVMRGLSFAIVDESDSVLVDEARTPLIISNQAEGMYNPIVYQHALATARKLRQGTEFKILASDRLIELTARSRAHISDQEWTATGISVNLQEREELVRQALAALHLFERDKHYLVTDGKVQIIDEFTGRLMPDRSWEGGLHQLIELNEGCEMTRHNETLARISYQRFFRRYLTLAGMTGTAREIAGELWSIYRLRVVTIPTHRPKQRRILSDRVHATAEKKWQAVVDRVAALHREGRPILVGTRSVADSEHLSRLMTDALLPHEVLNARQDKQEADIIARAGERSRITVATNMAGRGTDIHLAPMIAEMGGLHVIATERHESRRIDRQLFGRCARQGDPGSCEAIISLEDELVTLYVGNWLLWLACAIVKNPGASLSRWMGGGMVRLAQRAAERQHARMRHDLLKFDDRISDSLAFTGQME